MALLAVIMLVVGFEAAYALKPTYAATTTVITVDSGGQGYPVNCVIYGYQVYLFEGSGSVTTSTYSGLYTDYITVTSIGHQAGYISVTSTDTTTDSAGPGWNSTVCTWLPK